MINFFRKKSVAAEPIDASVPIGQRFYAIGDIHGRDDLLDALLALIAQDEAERGPAQTTFVFLGDLVDRGPGSAQVVERLLRLRDTRPEGSTRFLLGNHEEVFLTALKGDEEALRFFVRIGGRETILSYGVEEDHYTRMDYSELLAELVEAVPRSHVEFLSAFEDMVIAGSYAFVHAGVRPGTSLAHQKPKDLRWIRSDFLSHQAPFEKVIVHGHTITEQIDVQPHRIGLDTGAFASGKLTAMGFEGRDRWTLDTSD